MILTITVNTIITSRVFGGKYVFSTDHKVIGIQYAITGLIFLFLGFTLMMLMRWQLAYPGAPCRSLEMSLANFSGPGACRTGR